MTRDGLFISSALFLSLALAATGEAKADRTTTTPSAVVILKADVNCVVSVDAKTPYVLHADHPRTIRVTPGSHIFAAAFGNDDYWEKHVTLGAGAHSTVSLKFIPMVRQRLSRQAVLAIVRQRIAAAKAETESVKQRTMAIRSATEASKDVAERRAQEALAKVKAVVGKIRDLDRRFKADVAAADRLASQAGSLRAQASAQSSNSVVGSITGLVGNIGANHDLNESRLARLRALAALRRMNRLSQWLSIASDKGFDAPPDPSVVTTFAVRRQGIAGELSVGESLIRYHDLQSPNLTFGTGCGDLRSVKTNGKTITVRSKTAKVEVTSEREPAENTLGDILLERPGKSFDVAFNAPGQDQSAASAVSSVRGVMTSVENVRSQIGTVLQNGNDTLKGKAAIAALPQSSSASRNAQSGNSGAPSRLTPVVSPRPGAPQNASAAPPTSVVARSRDDLAGNWVVEGGTARLSGTVAGHPVSQQIPLIQSRVTLVKIADGVYQWNETGGGQSIQTTVRRQSRVLYTGAVDTAKAPAAPGITLHGTFTFQMRDRILVGETRQAASGPGGSIQLHANWTARRVGG
jgi:hypothetical protein